MRRSIRVLAGSLVAGALTITMVVGVPGVSPEQQASALCLSSIDLKCAGANAPIVIEAMVMAAEVHANTGGTGTVDAPQKVTAQVKPKGSRWGLIAQLGMEAIGGLLGFLGMHSEDDEGTIAAGGLTPEGFRGQLLRTDPKSLGNGTLRPCEKWSTAKPEYSRTDVCNTVPRHGLKGAGQIGEWSLVGDPVVTASTVTLVWRSTGAVSTDPVGATMMRCGITGQLEGTGQQLGAIYTGSGDRTVTYSCSNRPGEPMHHIVSSYYAYVPLNPGSPNYRVNELFNTVWHKAATGPEQGKISGSARLEVQCQKPDGSKSLVSLLHPYSVDPGTDIPLPDLKCPAGSVAVGGGVGVTPNGSTTEQAIIPRTEDQLLPAQKDFIAQKPQCFTAGEAACLLVLYVIGQNGGLQSCGNTAELCPDWAKDPAATERYKCQYGGSDVDLRYCSAYRLPGLGILPNVKADGSLEEITAPAPSNLQKPQPGSKPLPNTPNAEQVARACQDKNPSWFESLNPFWIVESVGCALRQAFTPRAEQIKATTARINAAFTRSGFGSVGTMLTALEHGVPVAGGCSGIPWEFKVRTLEVDASILNSCPGEPLAEVAGVIRGILVPLLWTGALLLWVRYIAGIIGYVPFGSTVNTNPGTGTTVHDIGTMTQIRPAIGGGGSQKAIGQ